MNLIDFINANDGMLTLGVLLYVIFMEGRLRVHEWRITALENKEKN